MSNKILDEVGEILKTAKLEINSLLTQAPAHGPLQLFVDHQLNQIVNRVAFLGGTPLTDNTTQTFKPITDFLGEKIEAQQAVTSEDINPAQLEQDAFNAKVNAGYDTFNQRDNDNILKSYTIPEDVLVLRGIARKAGVADYETAALNNDFVEKIREGIMTNEANEQAKQEFEKGLKDETTGTGKVKKLSEAELEQKLKGPKIDVNDALK